MSSPKVKKEYQIAVKSPFLQQDLFDVYEWTRDGVWDHIADDFIEDTRECFVTHELAMMELPNVKTWQVLYDSQLGGYVTCITDPVRYWLATCHVIFARRFWGHRNTVAPLKQIAQEIFDSGILKIQLLPFESNRAIHQLIEKLGGKREGILTAQTLKNGVPVSLVMYALYQQDLEVK